jgi:hypothetical protein
MFKKDALKILKQEEAAKAIGRDQSLISRMPNKVPERYHQPLLTAAKRKLKRLTNALHRMERE